MCFKTVVFLSGLSDDDDDEDEEDDDEEDDTPQGQAAPAAAATSDDDEEDDDDDYLDRLFDDILGGAYNTYKYSHMLLWFFVVARHLKVKQPNIK